jgi:outer membrane protein OmpA-like peptidoglycan-associated protein
MRTLYQGKSTAMFGAAVLVLLGTGCATKKYVGKVVTPVEARVTTNEKKIADSASAINELENNVSKVDEKAGEAGKSAAAANEAAKQAAASAGDARGRADSAQTRADSANKLAESTRTRLTEMAENIDNYKLVATENVLFPLNKHALTKEAKEQLDSAVSKIQSNKNYILEVQGFTDATGSAQSNLILSQRRADSVVRYLTVNHNLPLRKINVLGLGEDDPNADNKTRDGRKAARRVEIKVFALDLNAGKTGTTGF